MKAPSPVSLIRQLLCDPPSVGAVLAHSSAGHGMTHVELVFAPLVFVTLGVVGRRAPSAMTAIRARDSNGWPSFRADEMVSVDGAPVSQPILRLLAEPHTAGACEDVCLWRSRLTYDHSNAL